MSAPNVLPDSRERVISTPRNVTMSPMGYLVPIYCASCHREGGKVPEENMTFAFWLCDPCFAKYGELTAGMMMPDEVFWAKVRAAQEEKYGHTPTPEETIAHLADPESLESVLARCRQAMTPRAGG